MNQAVNLGDRATLDGTERLKLEHGVNNQELAILTRELEPVNLGQRKHKRARGVDKAGMNLLENFNLRVRHLTLLQTFNGMKVLIL